MRDRTVLIVDDDVAQRVFLTFDLLDFEVIEAASIVDGYNVAVDSQPDALIVDRRLPDGDGLDLVRRVRRNPKLVQIPVAVVTAAFDEAERETVMRAGADAYIAKPLDSGELEARLLHVIATEPAERRPQRLDQLNRIRSGLPAEEPTIDLREREQAKAHWYSRHRRHADAT